MYLNLLYIDARYDVIASIANCFGLNIAFLGSFSNNRSAISTLYFGGHELDSNFRYIHFILFALYFGLLHTFFIHTVNRLKEQPQPYKYTFLLITGLASIFFWMYATHRLSMYFSIFENSLQSFPRNSFFFVDGIRFKIGGIWNIVSTVVQSIYGLCNEMGSKLFDFRCNGKENLFYVLGNYSLLGYVQIYNHLLASLYGTVHFILRDYNGIIENVESELPAGTFLTDYVMLGFCILSWLSLGLIGILYSKKEIFYKYAITNIEVLPVLPASQDSMGNSGSNSKDVSFVAANLWKYKITKNH